MQFFTITAMTGILPIPKLHIWNIQRHDFTEELRFPEISFSPGIHRLNIDGIHLPWKGFFFNIHHNRYPERMKLPAKKHFFLICNASVLKRLKCSLILFLNNRFFGNSESIYKNLSPKYLIFKFYDTTTHSSHIFLFVKTLN